MRGSSFTLRLRPALLTELRKAAKAEGVSPTQLVNAAVAEKISALRTDEYFQQRAQRANRAETLRTLRRAGRSNPANKNDQIPFVWNMKMKCREMQHRAQEERRRRGICFRVNV